MVNAWESRLCSRAFFCFKLTGRDGQFSKRVNEVQPHSIDAVLSIFNHKIVPLRGTNDLLSMGLEENSAPDEPVD